MQPRRYHDWRHYCQKHLQKEWKTDIRQATSPREATDEPSGTRFFFFLIASPSPGGGYGRIDK
jgi:hypothetical protein